MAGAKRSILLTGMMAGVPHHGGATWAVLQYLLGFRRLGHDVYFVDPVEEADLEPCGAPLAHSLNAAYFRHVAGAFGVEDVSALLLAGTHETVGLPYGRLRQIAGGVDVLLNISGSLRDDLLSASIPLRIYLDLDPAFTQLWHATQGIDMHLAGHTHYVTVGLAIGDPECSIPTCGVQWLTTVQPIVLGAWPVGNRITYDGLTTVGNWRGYGSVTHQGVFYGQKAHSLREFITLPRRTEEKFMLALAIHPDEGNDLAALARNGWMLLDPASVVPTPADYGEFVRGSKAEFGIAKSGYVAARCGWFSERSICYLASGRPVIAQDTGFSRFLPTGDGLFSFGTAEDVLDAIEALRANYPAHARSARALAEEYFDSDRVLTGMLRGVGL